MEEKEVLKVGYGRVSMTDKQEASLENQKDLLKKFGCLIKIV